MAQEPLVNPIIGFGLVKLNCHTSFLTFGFGNDVQQLLSNRYIIYDCVSGYKAALEWVDDLIKNRPDSVDDHFRKNLIGYVTQTYGPKVLNHGGTFPFRDEDNGCFY